jgi:hypothetical protein
MCLYLQLTQLIVVSKRKVPMSYYPIFSKTAKGIPNRRSVLSTSDVVSYKARTPLRAFLCNDDAVATNKQKIPFKRLKPKRLIVESEEDSSDSGIISWLEDPVVAPVVYADAPPDDSLVFQDVLELPQDDAIGSSIAAAAINDAMRVAHARGSLYSASSSSSASPSPSSFVFATNK